MRRVNGAKSEPNFYWYIGVDDLNKLEKVGSEMGKAINEVKKFLKLKIKRDNSSNKIIGISEIKEHLQNKSDLKEAHEKISIKTRQYAKRQSTWARGQMQNWQKINPKDFKIELKKIQKNISKT